MINKLFSLSCKKERRIIGLMSGTSLDGLDIALCRISGSGCHTKVIVDEFTTIVYPEPLVQRIRNISQQQISLASLCSVNVELGNLYAAWINESIAKWRCTSDQVDLIASHGQTIYHLPRSIANTIVPSTLQIVDGDHIARLTGIITISDFRMKHVAAGGEGAPLAGYGDYLLFSEADNDVVMLNVGGISNFTFLPKHNSQQIICSDAGPGNTLIDSCMRKHFSVSHDNNGEVAAKGNIHEPLLAELKAHPFHRMPFPKTTGPEDFNYAYIEKCIMRSHSEQVSKEDIVATITKYSASEVADALRTITNANHFILYVSGGGLKNKTMMDHLANELPLATFRETENKGINADAKEAVLFAVLANECVAGSPGTFTGTGLLNIRMGKISFPD